MRKTVLIFVVIMASACMIPLDSPSTADVQESALVPPAPRPEFQFCDGFVTCTPGEINGDFNCTLDCSEPAWCPDYTSTELFKCQAHPLSSGCCERIDDPLDAVPCFQKRCIKGDRP